MCCRLSDSILFKNIWDCQTRLNMNALSQSPLRCHSCSSGNEGEKLNAEFLQMFPFIMLSQALQTPRRQPARTQSPVLGIHFRAQEGRQVWASHATGKTDKGPSKTLFCVSLVTSHVTCPKKEKIKRSCWVWWHTPIISARERLGQETREPKVNSGYTANSRPA